MWLWNYYKPCLLYESKVKVALIISYRIKDMLQFPLNISTAGLFGLLLKHFKRESRMWWKERLMIEESWYKNELCGRKHACIGGLPLLAPTVSVSAGDAKWLQVVPRERWIKATGRAVVFPCLWSQKVDSTGKPGKIWRWEKVLICSLSRALTRPCCKPLWWVFI